MAAPTFDLQSHSTYSDGTLPPAEVVARAARAGVELLALTDHDTVDGVGEALEAADGLRVIPATELSTIDGDHEDLHILGYGI
ncbi:MAG TPA: PHP domain-containing protein, partial [Baekduia sp.]|nr:PHP domain-containing protein [Baekduia sp.]